MSHAGQIEKIIAIRQMLEQTNALLKRQRRIKSDQVAALTRQVDQLGSEIRSIDKKHSENVDEFIRLGNELKELQTKTNLYTPG